MSTILVTGGAGFIKTNIVGIYTLLEAARAYWEQLDGKRQTNFRFHQVPTDEVYGDLPHPNDHNNSAVTSPRASMSSPGASTSSPCAKSQELQKKHHPSYHHRITHVTDRVGHDRRYAVDARKIRDTLRWETKNTFEDNLKTTVQWFVNTQTLAERVI